MEETIGQTLGGENAPASSGARAITRGASIGRYVVLDRLGEGGMGIVFAAYDPELDRKVAIKLLKVSGRDSERATEGHARLLREAQAMAKLSHPNVVTVHDVGEHDGGVFLAMEFVEGTTLGGWAAERKRSWTEVVAVFVSAGRGLSAAHAKGLVHRDFKPDNVMMAADGRVLVMDFGLARIDTEAGGPRPMDLLDEAELAATPGRIRSTSMTEAGAVLGTPAYMSPEQWTGLPTDSRTDQFSFCVALWEALYGVRPFRGETPAAIAFAVTEGEIAEAPSREVPSWLKRVVVRGLHADSDGRHPSMESLLDALSRGQRVRQRRVAAGVVVVLAAGIGAAIAVDRVRASQAHEACEAKGAAVDETWSDATRQALRESVTASGAGHASTTIELLMPVLDAKAAQWREARTELCLASEVRGEAQWSPNVAARAAWCLDDAHSQFEALVAQLRDADVDAVSNSVQAASNLPDIDACLDPTRLKRLPAPPEDEAMAGVRALRADVSRVGALQAVGNYEAGLELATSVVARAEALAWPPLTARARWRYGSLQTAVADFEAAEKTLEQAYFEAAHAGADETAFRVANQLAFVVGVERERHDDGLRWSEHARVSGGRLEDPSRLREARRLAARGNVLARQGKREQAQALHREALAIRKAALGTEHVLVAESTRSVARDLFEAAEYDAAMTLFVEGGAVFEAALGPDHPKVADALDDQASVHGRKGEYPRAAALQEKALAMRQRALGPDHPSVAATLNGMGITQYRLGNPARAIELFRETLATYERAYGKEHPKVATALSNLAALVSDNDPEEGRRLLERSLAIRRATLPGDHPDIADTLQNLANTYVDPVTHFSLPKGRELYEEVLRIREKAYGPRHPQTAQSLNSLGIVSQEARRFAAAAKYHARCLDIRRELLGEEHPKVATSIMRMGEVQFALGDLDQGLRTVKSAVDLLQRIDTAPQLVAEAQFTYGWLLERKSPGSREAEALMAKARGVFEADGAGKRIGQMENWLRQHARGEAPPGGDG